MMSTSTATIADVVFTDISTLRPGDKNANIRCIVLSSMGCRETSVGPITHFRVADESAAINMVLWGNLTDEIEEGDILTVTNAYASLFRARLQLSMSRTSAVERVGNITLLFNDDIDMSSFYWLARSESFEKTIIGDEREGIPGSGGLIVSGMVLVVVPSSSSEEDSIIIPDVESSDKTRRGFIQLNKQFKRVREFIDHYTSLAPRGRAEKALK